MTSDSQIINRQHAAVAGIGEKVLQKYFGFLPAWPIGTLRVPILMYHYISDNPNPGDKVRATLSVTPATFAAHIAYLARHGYSPLTLDSLYSIFRRQVTPPARPVVLTFDDGFVDFYLNAYPILRQYNFCAVSFIITGSAGQGNYLSWEQVQEMQASGLVSFQAHTVTHPDLTKLSPPALLRELEESRHTLQAKTGRAVDFIAYPYGKFNVHVLAAASQAGFAGGVATWRGKAGYACMNMPRVQVSEQWALSTFASRI